MERDGPLARGGHGEYPAGMREFMRRRFLAAGWLAGLLGLGAMGGVAAETPEPAASELATNSVLAPEPYTRVGHPDSNTVALQIAVRKFVPENGSNGPVLWLVGTAHIGDLEYYKTLQKQLDAQTVVLFEGVNADSHPRKAPKPGQPPDASKTGAFRPASTEQGTNAGFSMQSALAKSLGLVFQLDAIDYDRTNFFNSDLSVFDIQRLMLNDPDAEPARPGEPTKSDPSFDLLLEIMNGNSVLGKIFKWIVSYIGTNPELQAMTKYMLVETLGGLKGDFAEIRGLPPDMQHLLRVLIEARNQNVLNDIKTEFSLLPPGGTVAVFYGTGHMSDLEKRVVKELHYQSAGEEWHTAFSADLRETGMTPGQLGLFHRLIQAQLDQMQ